MTSGLRSNLGQTARILLVEDNDANRDLLTDYLNYCGYQVLGIPTGITFEAAMSDFQPDLVLLDLKLPEVSGYDLLAQISQNNDWKTIPVIVVSAYAFQADQKRALNMGARRYLVKPVRLSDLITAIAQELGN